MTKPPRSWTTGLGLKTLAILLLSTLLISCGASKKFDEFIPSRIISMGDALSYMDFSYGTDAVNPLTSIDPATGKTDHWLTVYAAGYGLTSLGASATGSKNVIFLNNDTYFKGLVSGPCPKITTPIPASNQPRCALGTYDTVSAQVASLPTPQSSDLVVITFGMGDVFEIADRLGNTPTDADLQQAIQDARDIGLSYINLADRVYQMGFKHVLAIPTLDYSSSAHVASKDLTNKSVTYSTNLTKLTQALILGANRNCNGGCVAGDNKTYPSRSEGVWIPYNQQANLSNWIQNVVLFGGTYGYPKANINNGSGTASKPLCPYVNPMPHEACDPSTSLTDSSGYPFFYSGDLFLTPSLHRIVGSFVYAYSRDTIGF